MCQVTRVPNGSVCGSCGLEDTVVAVFAALTLCLLIDDLDLGLAVEDLTRIGLAAPGIEQNVQEGENLGRKGGVWDQVMRSYLLSPPVRQSLSSLLQHDFYLCRYIN